MRILSAYEAAEISSRSREDLPRRVLLAVARGGGRRAAQIADEALGRLPTSAIPEVGFNWVGETLEWFVARGDVERGPGGRFRCVPPHLVDGAAENSPRLYGDPLAENRLDKALASVGAKVGRETAYANEDPAGDKPDKDTGLPIGMERFVFGRLDHARLVRACEGSGVALIRLEQLKAALPRITSVVTPPDGELTSIEIRTGFWEVYEPANEGNRWRTNGYWRSGRARLVRWRPSDDLRGAFNARVFYHVGEGRVAEMGGEMARLWQLHLDTQAKRPRTVWRDVTQVWVPRIAPTETQRWLQILSGRQSRRAGRWLVLEMDAAAAEESCSALAETLGLRRVEGRPPYDGPKRPWRGRRGA